MIREVTEKQEMTDVCKSGEGKTKCMTWLCWTSLKSRRMMIYLSEFYLQSGENCTKRDITKNLKLPGICIYTDKSTECLQDESKTGKATSGSEANRAVQDSCTSQSMLSQDQTLIHTSAS